MCNDIIVSSNIYSLYSHNIYYTNLTYKCNLNETFYSSIGRKVYAENVNLIKCHFTFKENKRFALCLICFLREYLMCVYEKARNNR
jgi:hypothetical protein